MQLKTMETTFLYANTDVVGLGADINCQETYVFINYGNKVKCFMYTRWQFHYIFRVILHKSLYWFSFLRAKL